MKFLCYRSVFVWEKLKMVKNLKYSRKLRNLCKNKKNTTYFIKHERNSVHLYSQNVGIGDI